MNEHNAKNYGLIKIAYSAHLDKVTRTSQAVSLGEILDTMEKAKTAKKIVYFMQWPNGSTTIINGNSAKVYTHLIKYRINWLEEQAERAKANDFLTYAANAKRWAHELRKGLIDGDIDAYIEVMARYH